MLSSLARCVSKQALHVLKGARSTSRPATVPLFGHQTLAAAPLPAVGGSPGVRQARALDHERLLQVEWDDGSCSLYPFTWLRDNCQCPLCTLQSAQARSLLLTDFDVHTGVDQVQLTESNKVRPKKFCGSSLFRIDFIVYYIIVVVTLHVQDLSGPSTHFMLQLIVWTPTQVSVTWPDQHSSVFEPDWLKKRCFSSEARQARQEELFLNGESV